MIPWFKIVAGGNLAEQFLSAGLLDEIIIFVAPIILGAGIRLFPGTNISAYKPLELVNTHRYANGLLQLEYRLKT